MKTVNARWKIPEDIYQEMERTAEIEHRDVNSVAEEMLSEAVKMRRCPGIIFADGATGRRARLAGTGLDVWEVIASYKSMGDSFGRLKSAYHWLEEDILRAALFYYECYPGEIDARSQRNEAWTSESTRKRYPFMTPR